MPKILRPNKVTWTFFGGFLGGNLVVLLLAVLLSALGVDPWPLFIALIIQIGWLYSLAGKLGLDVYGGSNELGAAPNGFGWITIVLGSLSTVFIYYTVASCLSHLRRRNQAVASSPKEGMDIY